MPGSCSADTPFAAGHTKSSNAARSLSSDRPLTFSKNCGIVFVGKWVATFNHVDAHLGQTLSDIQFVLQRKADPFPLRPIAEGRVIRADRGSVEPWFGVLLFGFFIFRG
jgi:hypothetical protein